jgi:hypothetical protein
MKTRFGFGPRNRCVRVLVVLAEALIEQIALVRGQRKVDSPRVCILDNAVPELLNEGEPRFQIELE